MREIGRMDADNSRRAEEPQNTDSVLGEITGRRLDVLLVHHESFYSLANVQCNLGILYIATYLREKGFTVKVMTPMDVFRFSEGDLERILRGYRPAVAGFYAYVDNIHHTRRLAARFKRMLPSIRTVAGGPLATALGPEILSKGHELDFAVVGEGEIPMERLARCLVKGEGALGDVPSLIRRGKSGILVNPHGGWLEDLDSLPIPDRSLIERPLRLSISTGRGCPYKCAFCFQAVHGGKYRYHSPERVVREISKNIEKYEFNAVDIIDDTFVADPSRVKELCRLLGLYRKNSGRDFIFYCEGRVNILAKSPWLLEELKAAGLVRLQVGIESGDEETLRLYRKNISLDDLRAVVARCRDLGGISIFGNFIIGGPFEREETFERSLSLAKELIREAPGVFEAGSSFLVPFPGTEIAGNPCRYGLTVRDAEFLTSLTLSEAACETERFSLAGLRRLKARFDRELLQAMRRAAPGTPRETVRNHFLWASRYGTVTRWFSGVFGTQGALANYFFFLTGGGFKPLKEVGPSEIAGMVPLRTVGPLQYDEGGESFLLKGGLKPLRIAKPVERAVYALSCGKLTILEIAEKVIEDFQLNVGPDELVKSHMLPLYRRMAADYQVVFHV